MFLMYNLPLNTSAPFNSTWQSIEFCSATEGVAPKFHTLPKNAFTPSLPTNEKSCDEIPNTSPIVVFSIAEISKRRSV